MADIFSTATWADLINESLADIGAMAAGQTISTSAQNDAFLRLGQLIDSFSADPLLALWEVQHGAFNLVVGTYKYTLGPGGTLSTASSPVRVTGASSNYLEFRKGMRLISMDQFSKEVQDSEGATAVLPSIAGVDTSWPNINVWVHHVPSTGGAVLELHYWVPMAQPASVSATVGFPPGFQRAIEKNLAVTLYAQYPRERGLDPALVKEAADSLEIIRNVNRAMLAEGILSQQASVNPPATPQTQT